MKQKKKKMESIEGDKIALKELIEEKTSKMDIIPSNGWNRQSDEAEQATKSELNLASLLK